MNGHDLDIVTRTLCGEAETQDVKDAEAIAWVIRNRVEYPNWPGSPAEVCLQPYQFSCWNANDPNRERIMKLDGSVPWFKTCRQIAQRVFEQPKAADPTSTSTHYYASWLKKPPKWARGKTPVYETPWGKFNHFFFNDIDTPPPQDAKQALDQQRPLTESKEMQVGGGAVATGTGLVANGSETGNTIVIVLGALIVLGGLFLVWNRYRARKEGKR